MLHSMQLYTSRHLSWRSLAMVRPVRANATCMSPVAVLMTDGYILVPRLPSEIFFQEGSGNETNSKLQPRPPKIIVVCYPHEVFGGGMKGVFSILIL